MGCHPSKDVVATAPAPPPADKNFRVSNDSGAWSEEALLAALDAMPAVLESARCSPLQPELPLPKPKTEVFEWGFDIFTVAYADLPALAYSALTSHPELSADVSKVDHSKLWRYVCELARYYHARPFHSFRHAVDVLLATSSLLRLVLRDHPEAVRDPIVIGALLVGALMHDANHPACMNGLLVATSHPLASESATAVLERHHASVGLALLARPELDFLGGLPEEGRARFVELVHEIVLATDVTTTMPKAKEFGALTEAGATPPIGLLSTLLIKAADISNPARPLSVYQRWIGGVMDEFFVQGDLERSKGLPISMNCDREKVVVAQSQVGFITFLVGPLYAALRSYAPSLQPMVEALESNKSHFAGLVSA